MRCISIATSSYVIIIIIIIIGISTIDLDMFLGSIPRLIAG
jgi:hypothetical protein